MPLDPGFRRGDDFLRNHQPLVGGVTSDRTEIQTHFVGRLLDRLYGGRPGGRNLDAVPDLLGPVALRGFSSAEGFWP